MKCHKMKIKLMKNLFKSNKVLISQTNKKQMNHCKMKRRKESNKKT